MLDTWAGIVGLHVGHLGGAGVVDLHVGHLGRRVSCSLGRGLG